MLGIAKKLWTRVRSDGVIQAASFARAQATERYFDWRYGIKTEAFYSAAELGLLEGYNPYHPTDWRSFRQVMRHVDVSPSDVFADYGCGLGRVVIMAASYPFRQVIGIEYSAVLADRARQNVASCRDKLRCEEISIVQADATTLVPPGDVTLMYFYSPFTVPVLHKVLARIKDSLDAAPRVIRIIYKNPAHFEAAAAAHGWLLKVAEYKQFSAHKYVVYEARLAE